MAKIVPHNRKRNVLWPLRRRGKGFVTGAMGQRYETAMRVLLLTPRGSMIWEPRFGTRIYELRTQVAGDIEVSRIRTELESAIRTWLPDIALLDLTAGRDPDSEELELKVTWGIPNADIGATDSGAVRFAFGPVNTTITI